VSTDLNDKWNGWSGAARVNGNGRSSAKRSFVNIYGESVRLNPNGFGFTLAHEVVHAIMFKFWEGASSVPFTDLGGHVNDYQHTKGDWRYFENLMNHGGLLNVDKIMSGKLGKHTKIPFDMRELIKIKAHSIRPIRP